MEAFIGVNQLRKSQGRFVGLWLGLTATDKEVVINPGLSVTINELITAFAAVTDNPATFTFNNKDLVVTSMLVCDEPITTATGEGSGLTVTNNGQVPVLLHIVYLNSTPAPAPAPV